MTDPMIEHDDAIRSISSKVESLRTTIEAIPAKVRNQYSSYSSFNVPGAIKRLDSTLSSVSEMMADLLQVSAILRDLPVSQEDSENLQIAISRLQDPLNVANMALESLAYRQNHMSDYKRIIDLMQGSANEMSVQQKELISTLRDLRDKQRAAGIITPDLDGAVKSWSSLLEIEQIRSSAESANEQVGRVLEVSRQAAGQVAENTLSLHFKKIADRERESSTKLRITAVVFLVLAAIFGYLITKGEASTAMLAERLSIGVPLLLLAAYFAREASHHRTMSRWAEEIEVKLLTLDAYIEPLDKDQQNLLRSEFGKQIYRIKEESTQSRDPGMSILGEVNGLLDRVANRK
ncbi:hypothetical protein [Amycolatopsis sp. NPDC050768]|uniref:hypothetical protein n=1 Tax=Amycolatopsis sp. NPDC050768 TaxID=3154839 RepID=UPI003403E838